MAVRAATGGLRASLPGTNPTTTHRCARRHSSHRPFTLSLAQRSPPAGRNWRRAHDAFRDQRGRGRRRRGPSSIRPFVDEAEEVYVVAPVLTTWMQWLTDESDSAVVSADERLRTVFAHMRAGGLQPHGEVGAENQVIAIADALARFDADLIVLRLHTPGSEH